MSSKASKNLRRSPRAPRKRKAKEPPVVSGPEPKRQCFEKKSRDGRDIDEYCWMCHKLGQDEKCFTCPRVYHTSCLEKSSCAFSAEGVCPECQLNSIDGTELSKTLTFQRLKELLLATTEQRNKIAHKEYAKNKIFIKWPENTGIVKVIDLEILVDKINDIVPYTKTSEFFSDVKWIQHNCFILYGADSKVTEAAMKLVKAFKTDLLDLEACPECYYHMLCSTSPNFFVRICEPPHDIIWAQVSGYPYWPAKCLKVVSGSAHVRFFGRHEMAKVPITQCYFISKDHPNHPQKSVPKTLKYNTSLHELRRYVGLYEREFGIGSFHYYNEKTAFKPKPSKNIQEEVIPVLKPKISAIPLHIDLNGVGNGPMNGNSAPISSSNAVTVNMTFTEEQSKTLGSEFDSTSTSINSTYDTVPSIDIQSWTATTVVTSTPIVATTDSLITLSDDLSLGAEFSNSNPVHELVRNKTTNNPLTASNTNEQILTGARETVILETVQRRNVAQESSSTAGNLPVSTCSSSVRNDNLTNARILSSSESTSISTRSSFDEELIVSYLSQGQSKNVNRNFKSMMYSLFVNLWALVHNAPSAPQVLTNIIGDIKKERDTILRLRMENGSLKRTIDRHQSVTNKLHEKITNLKLSLEDQKRKNEDLLMEFNDATKNAKLVVDSVKRSTDRIWTLKLKEYSTVCNQRLAEKDKKIAESQELLDGIRTDRDALLSQKQSLEKMYHTAMNKLSMLTSKQTVCQITQTDLLCADVFHRSEVDSLLSENAEFVKHNMEHELNEQIIQAKRNTFCYACLKPANIHCCMSANYCKTSCQRKHSKTHAKSCQRQKETRPRLEAEIPPPQQYCHPMINQAYARKTTSIHVQVEQSSNVITAANNLEATRYMYPPVSSTSAINAMYAAALEANNPINMPLNLMTTPSPDRFALRAPLLPTPPPILRATGLMCPSSTNIRHT